MPKFSVVTVCLDAGQDLIDTVQSVLNQTFGDFELLIKDGGSQDGSISSLPADQRIRLITSQDSGIYDAMNQAISFCTGELVIFMNAGDRFYRADVLEKISAVAEQKQSEIYYGGYYNRKLSQIVPAPATFGRFNCYRTMICHQSTVYDRRLLKKRGFDISYKHQADKDLLLYCVCNLGVNPADTGLIIADYQNDGESADAKYAEQNKKDIRRIYNSYYSFAEQIAYECLLALTFRKLRQFLSNSPVFGKLYSNAIGLLYSCLKKTDKQTKERQNE